MSTGRVTHTAAPGRDIALAAAASAAATAVAFAPELFRDPAATQSAPAVTVIWLLAVLSAAPVVAHLVIRRSRVSVGVGSALLVGLPQLPLLVALAMLDVWVDVRSGYLLAGSGEEAMSYGIGATVAAVVGAVLVGLVAVSVRWAARRSSTH